MVNYEKKLAGIIFKDFKDWVLTDVINFEGYTTLVFGKDNKIKGLQIMEEHIFILEDMKLTHE